MTAEIGQSRSGIRLGQEDTYIYSKKRRPLRTILNNCLSPVILSQSNQRFGHCLRRFAQTVERRRPLDTWAPALLQDKMNLRLRKIFYLFFLILSYTNRSLDFTYWKEKESSESGSTRNEPSNVCWLAAVAASLGIWTLPGYTGALRKQILHMDRGEPYKKMILSSQIWHAEGLYNLGTSGM